MEVTAPLSTTASERGVAVSRSRARRIADAALIAVFMVGICAPLIGVRLGQHGWDIASRADLRKTAEPLLLRMDQVHAITPTAKLKAVLKFPGQFKYYLSDHFGFRNLLIRLHGSLMVKELKVTSNPSVILGKHGWLFLADEGSLDDYRHTNPFKPAELEAWRAMLESRSQWCAAHGIHYLVVFAPSKHTIYPEEMPDIYTRFSQPTRLDQLTEALKDCSPPVEFVDLREPLLEAKKSGIRLFQKTDTHWNDRGAWIGYQAIMSTVKKDVPGVRVLTQSEFEPVTRLRPGMDLAGLLGLNDSYQEQSLDLAPRISLRLPHVEQDVVEPFTVEAGAQNKPGVVVFRDSYFTVLLPWLAESFGRGAYFWEYGFDKDVINAEHPAIVIQEIAERKLSLPAAAIGKEILPVHLVNGKWELNTPAN